jgi:hypothetical protein
LRDHIYEEKSEYSQRIEIYQAKALVMFR